MELPPKIASRVWMRIENGRYQNEEAVISAALDLLDERDEWLDEFLQRPEVLAHIDEGIAQANAGLSTSYTSEELRAYFDKLLNRISNNSSGDISSQ